MGVIDRSSAGSSVRSVRPMTIDHGTLCPLFNWLAIVSRPREGATGAAAAGDGFFELATKPRFEAGNAAVRIGFTAPRGERLTQKASPVDWGIDCCSPLAGTGCKNKSSANAAAAAIEMTPPRFIR